jgi:hypothetical protein
LLQLYTNLIPLFLSITLSFSSQTLYNRAVSFGQINSKAYLANQIIKGVRKMKKTLLIVTLAVLAIAALGVGVVFAQGGQPPVNGFGYGMMQAGGYGPMHTYVVEAFAAELDLSVEEVNTRLLNGETMYQIALAEGIAEDQVAALLTKVHTAAFDEAVAAGALTQEQADWMLERMQYMFQNGYGAGNCPMHGGARPQDGTGFRGGMGSGQGNVPGQGMMGGGRWQQVPAPQGSQY